MAEEKKEKEKEKEKEKPHVCTVCGKPSETTICHACEDRIRGEAVERKHEIDKAGRTDTGRK